ncbi:MAG TPA: phospholipase D-like domain-containing protein [Candidatus Acidoferrum sp.]|nr:phospholipase D-like domain-containing protein [Candidatus Acidoferrum sp.]
MTKGDQEESYSGSASHLLIDRMIGSGEKTLSIICPFISIYYAKILIRQSSRKRIRVITSNSRISEAAVKMMKRGRGPGHIKLMVYLIMLFVILLVLGIYPFYIAMIPVMAVVAVFPLMKRQGRSGIEVKVAVESFIHEKIYLSDTYAITGSANLTYSGTHKNIEHIEETHDAEKLKRLSMHFEDLWKGTEK